MSALAAAYQVSSVGIIDLPERRKLDFDEALPITAGPVENRAGK